MIERMLAAGIVGLPTARGRLGARQIPDGELLKEIEAARPNPPPERHLSRGGT